MPNKVPTSANQRVQGTVLKKCDRTRHSPQRSKACAARDVGQARGACQHTCQPRDTDTCRHAWTVRYSVGGRQREESFEDELYPGTRRIKPNSGLRKAQDFQLKLSTGKRKAVQRTGGAQSRHPRLPSGTAYPGLVTPDDLAGKQPADPSREADLGDRLARLRRLAGLTQEQVAERSGVSVDVIRKLEQHRKKSARLPTLHALARGLGTEVTALLGDPPDIASNGAPDPPALVELRRAVMPSLLPRSPDMSELAALSLSAVRQEIADGWSLYHSADFARLTPVLPGIIADARLLASVGSPEQKAAGSAALSKALQLAGHLAIRLGKTDLALSALERAAGAAGESGDPLLTPMVFNSVAWAYQRQNRLDDAEELAVTAADAVERGKLDSAARVRVWGGLVMSGATSAARMGNYDEARDMMETAEEGAGRLAALPPPPGDARMLSVFSKSSVRIERIRLAVQHARPEEALRLAKGTRLSPDIPPSWRTWLLLDVARAYTDMGDAERAVRTLETLRRVAPLWMRQHTLAVAIVTDLWAGHARPPGLRKLAEYLGVAA